MKISMSEYLRMFTVNERKYIDIESLRCNSPIEWPKQPEISIETDRNGLSRIIYSTPTKEKNTTRLDMNAISRAEYFTASGVELWLKVHFYLCIFFENKNIKNIKVSDKFIQKNLNELGCECTLNGIRTSIRRLQQDGFIRLIQTDQKKREVLELGGSNKDRCTRIIEINYDKIMELSSIFNLNCDSYKKLRPKSRARKYVRKRARSNRRRLKDQQVYYDYIQNVCSKNWSIKKMKYLKNVKGKSSKERQESNYITLGKEIRLYDYNGFLFDIDTGIRYNEYYDIKGDYIVLKYDELQETEREFVRQQTTQIDKERQAIRDFYSRINNPLTFE